MRSSAGVCALVVVCSACGRLDFAERTGDGDAQSPCTTLGPFGAPQLVAGINSTADDWSISMSGDEQVAVLASWRGGSASQVWQAVRSDRLVPFETPMLLTDVTAPPSDQSPVLSFDGLTVIVASQRTGTLGSYDFFAFTRPDLTSPFVPGPSLAELNTPANESRAWLSRDGLRIYFSSSRLGTEDLFTAARPSTSSPFGAPAPIAELNTPADESAPALSTTELEIYFTSSRPGGLGAEDIWVATRATTADAFGSAQNLTIANSTRDDAGAWLSGDDKTLYFNHDALEAGGANADIWSANRPCQ